MRCRSGQAGAGSRGTARLEAGRFGARRLPGEPIVAPRSRVARPVAWRLPPGSWAALRTALLRRAGLNAFRPGRAVPGFPAGCPAAARGRVLRIPAPAALARGPAAGFQAGRADAPRHAGPQSRARPARGAVRRQGSPGGPADAPAAARRAAQVPAEAPRHAAARRPLVRAGPVCRAAPGDPGAPRRVAPHQVRRPGSRVAAPARVARRAQRRAAARGSVRGDLPERPPGLARIAGPAIRPRAAARAAGQEGSAEWCLREGRRSW